MRVAAATTMQSACLIRKIVQRQQRQQQMRRTRTNTITQNFATYSTNVMGYRHNNNEDMNIDINRIRRRRLISTTCIYSSSTDDEEELEITQQQTGTQTVIITNMNKKQRLDELTLSTNPSLSRNVVQSWIQQGKVLVDGQKVTKPGTKLKPTVKIEVLAEEPKFVCRGGLKLEKALSFFNIDVNGKICLDSGLSTGGFTDCLLQKGARKVYGVDVGYGQVHEKIRTDERVVVMERQNLRYLETLPDLVECVTLDLSFISVLKVLPNVAKVSKLNSDLIVLIKPQFEARREQIGSKGVVRDTKVHEEVIQNVIKGAESIGYEYINHTDSPIRGAKEGNTEFLGHFRLANNNVLTAVEEDSGY